MTPHAVDCECLRCEDSRAGFKRTFYKGTTLRCDSNTVTVQGEDGYKHIFHRPADIPVHTWHQMYVVDKETTWSDAVTDNSALREKP